MKTQKIKLHKENVELLNSTGDVIVTRDEETFTHIPFWYQSTDKEGVYIERSFHELPDEVKASAMEIKKRRDEDSKRTKLTPSVLKGLEFVDKGKCPFELFKNMNYWVKNGICLFYNTPVAKDYQEKFYIGYAEMRQGQYVAVGFKWIGTMEELTEIYESIIGKPITQSID